MQVENSISSWTISGFLMCLFIGCFISCSTPKSITSTDDGQIEVAIVQMNDVYEIAGVDGGRSGGLSRVAHYFQEVQNKYPASMLVLAGDFLNPSLLGTMRYEGKRIRGKQMIETLNAMELDLVAFGNHEFDLNENDLQLRINESNFDWIATNLYQVCGDREYPFYKEVDGRKQFIPESKAYSLKDADGTTIDLGFFSATIPSNPVEYVQYYDADSCAALEIDHLKKSSDVLIGLTHLAIDQDLALAKMQPDVKLIMGGHEHNNMFYKVGSATVAKADANARTVYLHVISYNKRTGKVSINSDLIEINDQMPKDPVVDAIVQKWSKILEKNIKQVVDQPYEIVYRADQPLDGQETTIRHQPSNMGQMFTEAMLKASRQQSIAAIMNSGSIRIDDEISGDVTALDIFRALPFGGSVIEVSMTGNLLFGILRFSEKSKGTGAYLQYSGIEKKGNEWLIEGKSLDKEGTYTIVMTDFLLRGFDIPFLTHENTGISAIYRPDAADKKDVRNDIRRTIIEYLKRI